MLSSMISGVIWNFSSIGSLHRFWYDTAGCLLALQVVKAISDGSREVAEKILSMHGPISDEERIAAINENVESIRQSGVSAVVMSGMLQWISDPVQPAEEMLDALRKQTRG